MKLSSTYKTEQKELAIKEKELDQFIERTKETTTNTKKLLKLS